MCGWGVEAYGYNWERYPQSWRMDSDSCELRLIFDAVTGVPVIERGQLVNVG